MRFELCLCAQVRPLELATKVIVVASRRELQVPTNTGRLACQALSGSVLLARGDQDQPYDLREHLAPDRPSLLLYPGPEAQVLTAALVANLGGPVNLVVPDGNWRQTAKMRRRDPAMAVMPVVTLAPGEPSRYLVRRESKAAGLATIEAIARALGVLEGIGVQHALEMLLAEMVSRTLASRGTGAKLAPVSTGGLQKLQPLGL